MNGTAKIAKDIADYKYGVVDWLGDLYFIGEASYEDGTVNLYYHDEKITEDLFDVANGGTFYESRI